jgi:hypothetical protein
VPRKHPGEPLTDEQRVFTECVDDVLASTPGLHYACLTDPDEIGRAHPDVYAQFLIETGPDHDLALAVELTDKAFVLRVNGTPFVRKRGHSSRFEWWVERRCRDLERMIAGNLRVTQKTLMNLPVSSTLEVGRGDKWRKLGSFENGGLAVLAFLVPYGFVMGGKKQLVYEGWFETGEDA